MLEEQHLVALLVKIAVAASVASVLMRFRRIQEMIIRDDRTLAQRLQLGLVLSLIFGAGAVARIMTPNQYQAIDLALEASLIAGMIAGYVTGLVTGLCVALPAMFAGEFMSMPLFAAAGLIGGVLRDLASRTEDIWYFSPFIDLNLYHLVRGSLLRRQHVFGREAIRRAAFNVICNAAIVVTEFARVGISRQFPVHGVFSIARTWTGAGSTVVQFVAVAATALFCVSLPIRIWSSVRAEKQLESQRMRLTEARLAALTNQINPHFLFNTLNSVATLIRIDPAQARTVVYKLSNILRRLLRKTENFSPLREEIRFIDDYLAIEMVRFGEKLRFSKEVDESALDRLVPSMIFQPIIENSIKHGLASKVAGGTIRLSIWPDGARLNIVVEDDGVGIPPEKLATLLEQGIGVSNVNERLKVLFESDYLFEVESEGGNGTRTLIQLPEPRLQRQSQTPAIG